MNHMGINEVSHDLDQKIVSTPATLYRDVTPAEIFDNVKRVVDEVANQIRHQAMKPESEKPFAFILNVHVGMALQMEFEMLLMDMATSTRRHGGVVTFDVLQDYYEHD